MLDWILWPGLKLVKLIMGAGGGVLTALAGAALWYLFRNVGGV